MKKGTVIALAILASNWLTTVKAQSIDNAKKMFNYERFNTAKLELENILKATPNSVEAQYWLTLTLIQLSKKDEAKKIAQAAIATNDPLGYVALGTVDLFDSKKEEAKSNFEKAIAATTKKNKNIILQAIGRAHGSVGISQADTDYAIAKMNEVIAKEPNNTEAMVILGNVYRRAADGGGNAVRQYMNAVSINPQSAMAYYRMGQVYQTQDNCQFIKENYIKATNADPMYTAAWRELFEVYGNKESACYNLQEANSYLDKYVAATDQGLETEKIKMKFNYINNNLPVALKEAETMITKYGENSDNEILLYRAYIFTEMKDSVKALQAFDTYFAKIDPTKISARVARKAGEVALLVPGKENTAIAYLQKAIDVQTDNKLNIPTFNKMAEVYEKLKDFGMAATWYKKALAASDNQSANGIFKVGYAYYRAKDFVNSYTSFQQYDAKFPTDYRGSQWSARCQSALDTAYTTGAAVPLYERYLGIVINDSIKNKAGIVEAYTYLSVYNLNQGKKDIANNYLQKIKTLDPTNAGIAGLENAINPPKTAPKPAPVKTVPAKPATTKPTTTKPATTPAKPAPKPVAAIKKPTTPVKTAATTAKPVAKTTTTVKKN